MARRFFFELFLGFIAVLFSSLIVGCSSKPTDKEILNAAILFISNQNIGVSECDDIKTRIDIMNLIYDGSDKAKASIKYKIVFVNRGRQAEEISKEFADTKEFIDLTLKESKEQAAKERTASKAGVSKEIFEYKLEEISGELGRRLRDDIITKKSKQILSDYNRKCDDQVVKRLPIIVNKIIKELEKSNGIQEFSLEQSYMIGISRSRNGWVLDEI